MGGFLQKGGQNLAGGPPVQMGNSGGVDWSGINGQINQNNNANYGGFIQAQTAGMQPSIAQAQLKAATDQGIANTMAMAAGGRGANSGTTQHLAMQNEAMAGQEGAQQSGMLAAQQQQQAQQNALQYKGMMDQYNLGLYGAANTRDSNAAYTGIANQKALAGGEQGFTNFLGGLGGTALGAAKLMA